MSLRTIASTTGLGLKTVRSILGRQERDAGLRKREFNRMRAADFRRRHKERAALAGKVTAFRAKGDALVKQAKGIG
jgi:hypothetical protein